MRLLLAGAVSIAVLVPVAQAAQAPTKSQLPKMVLPDTALKTAASGLPQRYAFFTTAADAAASTADPNDTGADMKRLGLVAGYVRGRNARGAFAPRAGRGLHTVGSSVILFRDASAARAAIHRDTASSKRYSGKAVEGGVLVSFTSRTVPSLGSGAVLGHRHTRPTGGTDRWATTVSFLVGRLRGNVVVGRGDGTNADRLALDLAEQLRSRIVATLRHG